MMVAHGVDVGYQVRRRRRVVVADVDLELAAGELTLLAGPNGAGKSTLIRAMCGLRRPLAGRITIDGATVSDLDPLTLARRLAVVLTDRPSTLTMKGRELVALGRFPHRRAFAGPTAEDRRAIDAAIGEVGAEHLADRMLAELSDGERQRLMLARAIAQRPGVLVLDEPTAFLDYNGRLDLFEIVNRLCASGMAVLASSHDLELGFRHANRIAVVEPITGRPAAVTTGTPDSAQMGDTIERVFGPSARQHLVNSHER